MNISSSGSSSGVSDLYRGYEEFIGFADVDNSHECENSEINSLRRISSIAARYIFFLPLLSVLPPLRVWDNVQVIEVNMPECERVEDLSEEEIEEYRLNSQEEIQSHVEAYELPLKSDTSHQLTARNALNSEEIEKYISEYSVSDFGKRFCDSIQMIPMRDLSVGIISCVNTLNQLLDFDRPYAVGIRANKSQTWVAELALPFLQKMPSSTFVIGVDSWAGSKSESLPNNIQQFVVFDDASYSGSQLQTTIVELKKRIYERFGYERCHVYLVVPFATNNALNFLQKSQYIFDAPGNLEITFITTNRKIKTIRELFSENMLKILYDCVNNRSFKYVIKELYNENNRDKTLTHCDWKLADNHSTWQYIINRGLVKKEVLPPYKTNKKVDQGSELLG